jgi:hypothetical protein
MPRYDHDDAAVNDEHDDHDDDCDDDAADDDDGVRCGVLPPKSADETGCRLPAAVGTGDEVVDVAT